MQSPPLKTEPNQEKREVSTVATRSQAQFCTYLGESAANVSAKAARRGLSIEDYLKTIALERRGENWEREPGIKGRWVKQSN